MPDTATLKFPKLIAWVPHSDITAYELATALPVLFAMAHGAGSAAEQGEALPPAVRRHFQISENPYNN